MLLVAGALATFADYAMFVIASDHTRTPEHPERPPYVTSRLQSYFRRPTKEGALVEARGDVSKIEGDRGALMVRGQLTVISDGMCEVVLQFDGELRPLSSRKAVVEDSSI